MALNELAASLDITVDLPDYLFDAYGKVKEFDTLFEREYLFKIQEKYSLFDPEVFEAVLRSFDAFVQNGRLIKWALILRQVVLDSEDRDGLYGVPIPLLDGSAERDMLALFPLISLVEDAVKRYEAHGFSREETLRELKVFNESIRLSKTGRLAFDKGYFGWCAIYVYAMIFGYGALNFEITEFPGSVLVLENIKSGERILMMTAGRFHRSGFSLLCAGLGEDTDGSFDADFLETDTEYVGYVAADGLVIKERRNLPKSEWKKIFGKGDRGVSLHIPRGADVSPESVRETLKGGMKIAREHYGDGIGFAFCSSWLLSPNISECLPPESKIIAFENCFARYPRRSNGRELFSFVFGKRTDDFRDLPEKTSLQRRIKKIYLDGGYIYAGAGIITDKSFYS